MAPRVPFSLSVAIATKKADPTRDWVADIRPVLVRKSAISENVPSRDLYLTRYHALYLDGMLIPVCNLINGSTILVDSGRVSPGTRVFPHQAREP